MIRDYKDNRSIKLNEEWGFLSQTKPIHSSVLLLTLIDNMHLIILNYKNIMPIYIYLFNDNIFYLLIYYK